MKFLKNQAFGFYAEAVAIIAELVGFVFYFLNGKTATYGNLQINLVTTVGGVIGILLAIFIIAASGKVSENKGLRWVVDIAHLAVGILFTWGLAVFIADRVNLFASVLTFNKNAQTLADTQSAIYAIVALLVAVVAAVAASFTRVNKSED
ncbi:hypothetical protein ACFQY8_00490 [Alloscardovia venturai]|uniref:ABC transporter permease n=1 Tax=Alloscardovia venturai TaxID=1769421 RepID=A0ABW2Y1V6_9BIFI